MRVWRPVFPCFGIAEAMPSMRKHDGNSSSGRDGLILKLRSAQFVMF